MARLYSALARSAFVLASLLSLLAQPSRTAAAATAATAPATASANNKRARSVNVNVIVTMKERTDDVVQTLQALEFTSRSKRSQAFKEGLESHAARTQQDLFALLDQSGATYTRSESFWLTNQVFIESASPALVSRIAKLPSVLSVQPEQVFPMAFPTLATSSTVKTSAAAPQWGVNKIRAPEVWATGNTGKGVVVGVIDTGVRHTHKDIASNFRRAYGWYDPEKKSATPYDATGHGTHVVGTIAGANGIGVAPGVTWIMCKGCRSNGCYGSDLLACFQFMACPTTPDGLTKNCTMAPDVVNNSWGAGQGITMFDSILGTWHANQIIPVFAAGNAGPSCTTVTSPGDTLNVITVGATTSSDALASFSSKGPTVNGLRKPDVLAPGDMIRSSCFTGDADYCVKSGTSMAAPHVTGIIALYLSRYPAPVIKSTTALTANNAPYADVVRALRASALTTVLTTRTGYTCGNTADTVFPNNQFGFGRLDAMRLLSIVPSYSTGSTTTAPAPTTPAPTPTTPAPTTRAPTTAPVTTAPVTTTPAPTTRAPTTAPTSAPALTTSCRLETGIDYNAFDIGNAPATAASSCCAICAARVGCKAFSWSNYNGGTCWLKSQRSTTTVNSGVTSGTI